MPLINHHFQCFRLFEKCYVRQWEVLSHKGLGYITKSSLSDKILEWEMMNCVNKLISSEMMWISCHENSHWKPVKWFQFVLVYSSKQMCLTYHLFNYSWCVAYHTTSFFKGKGRSSCHNNKALHYPGKLRQLYLKWMEKKRTLTN